MSLYYSDKKAVSQLHFSNGSSKLPIKELYYSDGSTKSLIWSNGINKDNYYVVFMNSYRGDNGDVLIFNSAGDTLVNHFTPGDQGNYSGTDYFGNFYTNTSAINSFSMYCFLYDSQQNTFYREITSSSEGPNVGSILNPVTLDRYAIGSASGRNNMKYIKWTATSKTPSSFSYSPSAQITTTITSSATGNNNYYPGNYAALFIGNDIYFVLPKYQSTSSFLWKITNIVNLGTEGTNLQVVSNPFSTDSNWNILFPSSLENKTPFYWLCQHSDYNNTQYPFNIYRVDGTTMTEVFSYSSTSVLYNSFTKLGFSYKRNEYIFSCWDYKTRIMQMAVFDFNTEKMTFYPIKEGTGFLVPQGSSSDRIVTYLISTEYIEPLGSAALYNITLNKYINGTLVNSTVFPRERLLTGLSSSGFTTHYFDYYKN